MEVAGHLVEGESAMDPASVLLGVEVVPPGGHVGVQLGVAGLPEDVLQLVILLPQVLVQTLHLYPVDNSVV